VASEIVIPEAGWYNISLRYNSRYVYGWHEKTGGFYTWHPRFVGDLTPIRPSMMSIARWESSGIGAIAQLEREEITDDYSSAEFV
jgi:hypothetical protein